MQLLGVTRRMVTILLAMVVMAGVVAVEGAQAGRKDFDRLVSRHGGDLTITRSYQQPENRTKCQVSDTRNDKAWKKYVFYRPGKIDAWACYDYWRKNGHPGLRDVY